MSMTITRSKNNATRARAIKFAGSKSGAAGGNPNKFAGGKSSKSKVGMGSPARGGATVYGI